jgi:Cft2 family RNA processing exonuclease
VSELECITYGVGHADEGVCLLMRLGPYRVLLDCGLGHLAPLQSASPPADFVLCSHAHSDHAQGLRALHDAFPHLPIYGSEVTSQLLPLSGVPTDLCRTLPWRTPVEFLEGLSVACYPAGHLPGAAAFLLTYTPPTRGAKSYKVFYTGDCFLSPSRLVEGFPLEELRGLCPDVLIVEGSYGTARHPHRRQQENQLAERIHRAIAQNQSVLLRAKALGPAQELLMLLRSHHRFTGRNLDIWVDRAIAIGCDAYLDILPFLPANVRNFARHQPLFWDEKVRPRVRRLPDAQDLSALPSPCILVTDRAAPTPLDPPNHWLTLTVQDSPPTQAGTTYLLAQHCDGPGTTQLIHNLRPQHLVLVHGSPADLADLTGLEELHNRYQIHLPAAGSVVDLPVGDTFLQTAVPDAPYAGELLALESGVTISLPEALLTDPRWQRLADTGLVEARWQGEELVLRGVSQQDLRRQVSGDRLVDWVDANSPLRQSCAFCRHYRRQRCGNPDSPLFELKVTTDGFCLAFEPAPD